MEQTKQQKQKKKSYPRYCHILVTGTCGKYRRIYLPISSPIKTGDIVLVSTLSPQEIRDVRDSHMYHAVWGKRANIPEGEGLF